MALVERSRQMDAVRMVMKDRRWHTLFFIQEQVTAQGVSASLTGISARVRDLRKAEEGAHIVETRCVSRGTWEYRLVN